MERPLREYSSKNREIQSLAGTQNSLTGLAKNVEAAQKKVDKAREKGAKNAEKLAGAISSAEEVSQQWDTRAPLVFEQLQAADEGRLNQLRDVLTQLVTHEVDQVERCRQAAESCLNVLLNVETADEIKTFAAKMMGNRRPVSPVRSRRQPSQAETPPAAPVTIETPPAIAAEPLAPPLRVQDDTASQRSGQSDRLATIQTPPGMSSHSQLPSKL